MFPFLSSVSLITAMMSKSFLSLVFNRFIAGRSFYTNESGDVPLQWQGQVYWEQYRAGRALSFRCVRWVYDSSFVLHKITWKYHLTSIYHYYPVQGEDMSMTPINNTPQRWYSCLPANDGSNGEIMKKGWNRAEHVHFFGEKYMRNYIIRNLTKSVSL